MKFFKAVIFTCLVFIMTAGAFALTADEWVAEGKEELVANMNIKAALSAFDAALSIDPNHNKANFWRALILSGTNANVLSALRDLKILDGDDLPAVFDAEMQINYDVFNAVDNIILDDTEAVFTGTWALLSEPGEASDAYKEGCRSHASGTGANTAVYNLILPCAGYYKVYVWSPKAPGIIDETFKINHAGSEFTMKLHREYSPFGEWRWLGQFKFNKTGDSITLTDQSAYPVYADGIKLVFEGSIKDNSDASGFTTSGGGWTLLEDERSFNGSCLVNNGTPGASATWTLDVPASGQYQVFTRAELPSGTEYTITPSGAASSLIKLKKNIYNNDWVCLGVYGLAAGTDVTITLASNTQGRVMADAIKLVPCRPVPNMTEAQNILTGLVDSQFSGAEIEMALLNVQKALDTGFNDTIELPDGTIGYIDHGEVKLLEAFLYLVKTMTYVDMAYEGSAADIQKILLGLDPIGTLLNDFPNALTLRPDAANSLLSAKTALENALNCYSEASAFIRGRSDTDGLNHAISFYPQCPPAYDPSTYPSYEAWQEAMNEWQEEKDSSLEAESSIRGILEDVYANLTAHSENLFVSLPIPIDGDEYIFGQDGPKIDVDPFTFFTEPKDISLFVNGLLADDMVKNSFTDPTFGGVLPNMTPEDWNHFLAKGPEIPDAPIVCWTNDIPSVTISWKKVPPAFRGAFIKYEVYRSTNYNVSKASELVSTITDVNTAMLTDSNLSGNEDVYYYKVYAYYDFSQGKDGTDTAAAYGLSRKAVIRVFVDKGYTEDDFDGSREHPYNDIKEALLKVSNITGIKMCVAQGSYDGCLFICRNKGLILEGGYDADKWTRDITVNETSISSDGTTSEIVYIGSNNVILDGFSILGSTNTPSSGSVGLYAQDVLVRNCKIKFNGVSYGVFIYNAKATISNNLFFGNHGGIEVFGSSSDVTIMNNMVASNGPGYAIYVSSAKKAVVANNIAYNTNSGIGCGEVTNKQVYNNNVYNSTTASWNYVNCGTSAGQNGNISADPLFVDYANGDYHLKQISAGQTVTSPCVDSGAQTAAAADLDKMSTRTDGIYDTGIVDMGYHYYVSDESKKSELVAGFGSSLGLWMRYSDAHWIVLHSMTPVSMLTADMDNNCEKEVVANFGSPYGIWYYTANTASWTSFHPAAAKTMASGDIDGNGQDDMVIDFGTEHAIWVKYNNLTWSKLHSLTANNISTGDVNGDSKDEVIVDFGSAHGIWIYYPATGSWQFLHHVTAKSITTGDIDGNGQDDLVVDFGDSHGVWIYFNNSTWSLLRSISARQVVLGDVNNDSKKEVIVDFGASYGIWMYRPATSSWSFIHPATGVNIICTDLDGNKKDEMIVDFGALYGIWAYYNDSTWSLIHSKTAVSMVGGNIDN